MAKKTTAKKTATKESAAKKTTTRRTAKVKTASVRRTPAKKPMLQAEAPMMMSASQPMMLPPMSDSSKKWLIGGAAVLAIGLGAYFFKGFAIAALVNGQPVSRLSVLQEAEKMDGSQILDGLVVQALITQAAAKQKIVVNPGDVDAEMQKLETQVKSQGRDLDQLLSLQGMSRDVLKKQIELQKMVEKLSGADAITVSDAEVKDYIASNSAMFPKSLTADEVTSQASLQLKSQKAQNLIQAFIDELRQSAHIQYFVNYQ